MKIEPIPYTPIVFDELNVVFDELNERFNVIQSIMQDNFRKIVKDRERQIFEKLKSIGIEFTSEDEKLEFAKTRLSIRVYEQHPTYREMYLDGSLLIATWYNTAELETKDGLNYTIVSGKQPRLFSPQSE